MPSVIIDGRALQLYSFGKPGFSGATENYGRILARGLAERGYTVHVLANDLDGDEQRGEREWWWGPDAFPKRADYWVGLHSLAGVPGFTAQHFILAPNAIDPPMGEDEWGERLSAVACLTQVHADMLVERRPTISPDICKVTGLGINPSDYPDPSKWEDVGRFEHRARHFREHGFLFANDPARGLHHTLAIFDEIRHEMSDAQMHVAYDFDRQFENYRWQASAMAERLWECKERIERGDGVVNLGALKHDDLVAEQLACDLHIYPSDPPNVGSQLHGLTQLELAAAGVPLILSPIEAFPEVFAECATFLPIPGTLARASEDELERITAADWASVAIDFMTDRDKWQAASEAGRAVAAQNTWEMCIDRWQSLLESLPLD